MPPASSWLGTQLYVARPREGASEVGVKMQHNFCGKDRSGQQCSYVSVRRTEIQRISVPPGELDCMLAAGELHPLLPLKNVGPCNWD